MRDWRCSIAGTQSALRDEYHLNSNDADIVGAGSGEVGDFEGYRVPRNGAEAVTGTAQHNPGIVRGRDSSTGSTTISAGPARGRLGKCGQ